MFDCDLYVKERIEFSNLIKHKNNNLDNLTPLEKMSYLFNETPRMLGKFLKSIVEIRKRTLYI